MKRCLPLAPALVAGLFLCTGASAAGPTLAARAYVIQNAATGEVLAAKRGRLRVPIASITKLMTVLVALDHAQPDDPILVSKAAANVDGSQAGLYGGEVFSVRELIGAALVPSANDAADALADGVSKGRRALFVLWMNQKARALGMTDTHFVRPEGLDAPGQLSSARDVAILAEAAMLLPLVRRTVLLPAIEIGGLRLLSRNDLLRTFPGILGIKTGTTDKAGWSQVAAARRDAVTVYAVVLGSANRGARNRNVAALLEWGLDRYRTIRAIDPGKVYARVRLPYGARPLDLVVARPVWRVVHVDRPLVERIVAPTTLTVPVRRGQRVGELRVYEGRTLVASAPLLAARSVGRPALGGRLAFYAGRTAHYVWSWLS